MASPLASVDDDREAGRRLRRVEVALRAGALVPEPEARWLADAIEEHLRRRHEGFGLDDALGMPRRRLAESSWKSDLRSFRDDALRELARRYMAGQPVAAQARAIAVLMVRYEASAWRGDRFRGQMPEDYRGTSHEQLFRAFTHLPGALSQAQLRRVLSARSGA